MSEISKLFTKKLIKIFNIKSAVSPWDYVSPEQKAAREEAEFEHKLHGNSVHWSVYRPDMYPDYFKSKKEWLLECSHNQFARLSLKRQGIDVDEELEEVRN